MFPSFVLFGREVPMYAVCAICGMLAAGFAACRNAGRRGFDPDDIIITLLIAGAGAFLGSHLLYAAVNYRLLAYYAGHPGLLRSWSGFTEAFINCFGGSVFYGGLLGGLAAGLVFIKKKHWDTGCCCDIIAPCIPLFHAFGRLGCFFGGCCYGIECSFGITFTHSPAPGANGVSRFPVSLLGVCFNLALSLTLFLLFWKKRLEGRLMLLYIAVYAPGRFAAEFLRGDIYRGALLGLSVSQWVSIVMSVFALCALIKFIINKHRKEDIL